MEEKTQWVKDPDHGIIWPPILGAFGAHQFYAKRPVLGLLYLATFWSGFSAAMTIVDFIIAVPMKPDENGNIWL